MKKNQTKRRFVAVGDLVADCYYQNENGKKTLVKVDGGASRFNVLANLASRGYRTKVFSSCGSDEIGDIIINFMRSLGIDTSSVFRNSNQTLKYHIILSTYGSHQCEKICPICHKRTWYDEPIVNFVYYIDKMQLRDVLILDSISIETRDLILNTVNDKVLDLGRTKKLYPLTKEEIKHFLKRKFEILQLNELVEKCLLDKLEIETLEELYEILQPKLLIVTRSNAGTDFVYQNQVYTKILKDPSPEIDNTGAGDAFLSVIIQEYYDNNKKVNKQFIDKAFRKATRVTKEVVSHLGARGHLYDGYYPEDTYNCICEK